MVSAFASLRLDLDLLTLRALRLRDADREDSLLKARLDLRGVDLLRKSDAVLEAPGTARSSPQRALALLLLDLARDRELVADDLDVHVVALDARKLRLEDVDVVLLFDVHERRPAGPLGQQRRRPAATDRLLEHPAHALRHLLELAERLPPIRRSRGPTLWKNLRHHVPPSSVCW